MRYIASIAIFLALGIASLRGADKFFEWLSPITGIKEPYLSIYSLHACFYIVIISLLIITLLIYRAYRRG